jgi:hypothetical protein
MKYIIWIIVVMIAFNDGKAQDLKPFRDDKLWGYRNKQGSVKILPEYQYATRFVWNMAIVARNDTLGAIDSNNALIVPFKYQYLRPLDSTEFLFGHRAVYYGEYDIGVMTKDQVVKILPEYRWISKKRNCYTVMKQVDSLIEKSPDGDVRSMKSFYGLLDSTGKVVISCKYDYLNWLNDSLIVLTTGGKGTDQALFDKNGHQLTDFIYMVIDKFHEGLAKARIGNKFGFLYPNGKIAIPITFEYCEIFKNGYALILEKENWGAIDKQGRIIIEANYTREAVEKMLKEKESLQSDS